MKKITLLITGGIGSGKTTVAKYLTETYGIPVFYSDTEAKKLYEDPKILAQVNEIVGGGIISGDNKLDKKALAEIIFNDESMRKQVEAIIHPKVRENFQIWKDGKVTPIVAMESAAALKNGRQGFDYVIMVDASEDIRLERTMKRDNSPREKILERMRTQEFDRDLIDFTINNEFNFKPITDTLIKDLIENNSTKALFAGSFDPFTNGHLSIVKQACAIFDKVYLCIAKNTGKTRRFLLFDRMENAIRETIKLEGLDNCEVIVCEEMVADLCQKLGVKYLVRGLRDTMDYMYEEKISKINNKINPDLKTIYLRGCDDLTSSSTVVEFLKFNKPVDEFLPAPILQLYQPKE
jgi:pantetheine-phosphate adenylyltransferase/dephospho-CoA kinase